jgi:DNA-binding response OmpR family regulator
MAFVLLIEPDTELARTYAQALQLAGHESATAATAQAAIDAADQRTPDIVVLELQLPAHNGIEFLHEFRSYAEWQTTPVIINTYTSPQQLAPARRALAEDLGVRATHYKPQTSLQLLLRSINEHAEPQ